LLEITSNDATPVKLKIYDSQIHTSIVQTVPLGNAGTNTSNCNSNDLVPTDAYVLQGGSATGCDSGDPFEVAQGTGSATLSGGGYSFGITTQYLENGQTVNCTSEAIPVICATPDTGFLTVTNTGSSFNGTITLTGTSPITQTQNASCAPGGLAADGFTGTLAANDSVTLALSTDSSNCGGFNQSQQLTLGAPGSATNPITFKAGNDTFTVTGANNTGGEVITFLPTPVLSGSFNPGQLFSADGCDSYSDFSAPSGATNGPNPVCVEFRLQCTGADCKSFSSQVSTFFVPVPDPPPGIPVFLKADNATCPPSGFDQNIFFSYTFFGQIRKSGGGGGGSCFVAGNAPGTPRGGGTQNVSLSSYISNFFAPLSVPPAFTTSKAGSADPTIWQAFDSNNNLVTNPKFYSGGFCTKINLTLCNPNSVAVAYVPINCASFLPTDGQIHTTVGFTIQFNPVNNTFQVNPKSPSNLAGQCVALELFLIGNPTTLQSTRTAFLKLK